MKSDESDAIFWDRLQDMPAWEAEQECVMRREELSMQNAMLMTERTKMAPAIGRTQQAEYAALGLAIADNNAKLTKLAERIKYLRNLQNRICWKQTVLQLFGEEVVQQCLIHMEIQWAEVMKKRREWAA